MYVFSKILIKQKCGWLFHCCWSFTDPYTNSKRDNWECVHAQFLSYFWLWDPPDCISWFQNGSVKWVFKGEIMRKWGRSIYSLGQLRIKEVAEKSCCYFGCMTVHSTCFRAHSCPWSNLVYTSSLLTSHIWWKYLPSLIQLHPSVI